MFLNNFPRCDIKIFSNYQGNIPIRAVDKRQLKMTYAIVLAFPARKLKVLWGSARGQVLLPSCHPSAALLPGQDQHVCAMAKSLCFLKLLLAPKPVSIPSQCKINTQFVSSTKQMWFRFEWRD